MTKADRERIKAACEAKKALPSPPNGQKATPVRKVIPRLPDGSRFEATYHENGEYWDGVLKVQGQVFMARCKGVFGLMGQLDQCYRRSLRLPPVK